MVVDPEDGFAKETGNAQYGNGEAIGLDGHSVGGDQFVQDPFVGTEAVMANLVQNAVAD